MRSSTVSEGFETKGSVGLVSKGLDAFAKVLDEATLGGTMITKKIPKYRLQDRRPSPRCRRCGPRDHQTGPLDQIRKRTRHDELTDLALKPLCGAPPWAEALANRVSGGGQGSSRRSTSGSTAPRR